MDAKRLIQALDAGPPDVTLRFSMLSAREALKGSEKDSRLGEVGAVPTLWKSQPVARNPS